MTTGRINQVTILNGAAEAPPRPRGVECTRKATRTSRQPGHPGDESLGRRTTIQLPPLNFPQGIPPHKRSGPEASRSATSAPRAEDTLSRTRRSGHQPRLTPKLLSIGMASGQVSTASNNARQRADGRVGCLLGSPWGANWRAP
jgi:hypothetical protein